MATAPGTWKSDDTTLWGRPPAAPEPVPAVSSALVRTSVLHLRPGDADRQRPPAGDDVVGDLHLDEIVTAITAGYEHYRLEEVFLTPQADPDTIAFRHEVMRDLEQPARRAAVASFAATMAHMREHLALGRRLHHRYQQCWWYLAAIRRYCEAVTTLASDLEADPPSSRGLSAIRTYVADYVAGTAFGALKQEAERVSAALDEIRYSLLIKGNRIQVSFYDGEADYSRHIACTFAKFQGGATKEEDREHPASTDMDHIEGQILDRVALLHPETFAALVDLAVRHERYADPTIQAFDRDVQFYCASLDHVETHRRAGLGFCYPTILVDDKRVSARGVFDLALADKVLDEHVTVVTNDFELHDGERALVVSGPNQGGKTTFARTFGQLHHLASIGCLVPGQEARLFLFDEMHTQFEREEHIENLRGRLEEDLERVHAILARITSRSIVIMNELFTSTTLTDAIFLGTRIIQAVVDADALCVYVTFVDELSSLSHQTVSLVSTVDADDPTIRTYKIVRRAADGRSYAASIAARYQLTYEDIDRRIP